MLILSTRHCEDSVPSLKLMEKRRLGISMPVRGNLYEPTDFTKLDKKKIVSGPLHAD